MVTLTVLTHMAREADKNGAIVRFVDVSPESLAQLREACGQKFLIRPLAEAERTENDIHLKNTKREGVVIQVELKEVLGDRATAYGSYIGPTSGVGIRYSLRRVNGDWQIVSTEFISAT